MKAESSAECSLWSIYASMGAYCNTFDLHLALISLENQFWSDREWPFYTGYCTHKTKILMTNSSLRKVESIAFCNTFDLH